MFITILVVLTSGVHCKHTQPVDIQCKPRKPPRTANWVTNSGGESSHASLECLIDVVALELAEIASGLAVVVMVYFLSGV